MIAAFTLGLRHGFDWDHIAAISDLTGTQSRPARSVLLATLYVLGHATMILALGSVAILFGDQIPSALDDAMGYVVGVTLVMLALYLLWTVARTRDAPVVSRWMLVIGLARKCLRRVSHREETIVIEHAHEHTHNTPLPTAHLTPPAQGGRHDHQHDAAQLRALRARDPSEDARVATSTRHGHLHRHVIAMPDDPFLPVGPWSAAGVGMLHGVGAETPTQILVFATAANATGRVAPFAVLLSFLVGLVCSNTCIALGTTFGFLGARGSRVLLVSLSLVTAAVSLVVGVLLLTGRSEVLPAIFPGSRM